MPNAITAIFGANSAQYKAELAMMVASSAAAGNRISANLSGGGAHGPQGMTGIIRESTVIAREVSMGRGLGRILGSMSLLVQYLKSYSSGAQVAESYSEQLAAGYERLALQAKLAAVAAKRKAIASAEVVTATNAEDASTIEAAAADAAKATAADKAAQAAHEKAIAAREAAEAERMEAIASGEATAASLPLMAIFIGIVAVLAVLYGAYKVVHGMLGELNDRKIKAAELARELALSMEQEAETVDRLSKAYEQAVDHLHKMAQGHADYAKKVNDAAEANKTLFEAQEKLYGLKKTADLTQIDIDEDSGKITKAEAIKRRGEVEKAEIVRSNAAKTKQLRGEAEFYNQADRMAAAEAAKKRKAADDAAAALNSPEGQAAALELARRENVEKKAYELADKKAKEADALPKGKNAFSDRQRSNDLKIAAALKTAGDMAHEQTQEQRAKMKPSELAASDAMTAAENATQSAKTLSEKHKEAVKAWTNQAAIAPLETAAELKNVDLETKDKLLKEQNKENHAAGYGLNANQRIGAYAATPPIWKEQLDQLKRIAHNTEGRSDRNAPPGTRAPQLGTVPNSYNFH